MGCGCRGSGFKSQKQKAEERAAARAAKQAQPTVIDRSYYAAKKPPTYNGPEPKSA